jgi:anaphase-promoting complex subunit 6
LKFKKKIGFLKKKKKKKNFKIIKKEFIVFNLAHTYRRLQMFDYSIYYYEAALKLDPKNSSIFSSIGFNYHLQKNYNTAIEYYHKALGLNYF